MNYDDNMAELESRLAAMRERRSRLAYDLQYGRNEASDPGRRDALQIEIKELDASIRTHEMALGRGGGRQDPLSSVNERLDVLTRIIEGDQATGYAGVRQVVKLQEELLITMRVKVGQLVWGFWAILLIFSVSTLGQLFFMWRLTG